MGSLAGTLNTAVTAGKKNPIDFVVGNAGTAPVRNLGFVTKKPSDKWTVEFKPDKIDALEPGRSAGNQNGSTRTGSHHRGRLYDDAYGKLAGRD